MEDLVVHLVIVAPLIRWIINPERFWNRRHKESGAYLAVLVLLAISAAQFIRLEPSHYKTLGVFASASRSEIGSAYRRQIKLYHPDNSTDANAEEKFRTISHAYEVLSDDNSRQIYDCFGDINPTGKDESTNTRDAAIMAILFCILPLLFGLIYSMDSDDWWSRKVIILATAFSFLLELKLRFEEYSREVDAWIPLVGRLARFEQVQALHSLQSVVMNGALTLLSGKYQSDNSLVMAVQMYEYHWTRKLMTMLDRQIEWIRAIERYYPVEGRVPFSYETYESSRRLQLMSDSWLAAWGESLRTRPNNQVVPVLPSREQVRHPSFKDKLHAEYIQKCEKTGGEPISIGRYVFLGVLFWRISSHILSK